MSAGPGGHTPWQRYLTPTGRLRAVLETSFWVAACRAEVAANCFDFFEVVVPQAVETEICAREVRHPRREYPYSTLFRQLRAKMTDPPTEALPRLPVLDPGEAEAIPLAEVLPGVLLINERQGSDYARRLGVPVITVPAFIVLLRGLDVISDRAARRKLDLIASITTPGFIADARRYLDLLA